jgi:hypothetical protein
MAYTGGERSSGNVLGVEFDMNAELNERPGCLASILSSLGIKKIPGQEALPYHIRDDFLSAAEYSFYWVLQTVVGTKYTILAKVRLGDIFFVSYPRMNIAYINRINQKHVDFLLCAPDTMRPAVGIELDDASHKKAKRQQRDEFVDQVFGSAGLPLLHVPVQREYNAREIADQIIQLLKAHSVAATKPKVEKEKTYIPLCPRCGIPMILRISSQGGHKGQQFYGCQNYPRCREMLPVTKAR